MTSVILAMAATEVWVLDWMASIFLLMSSVDRAVSLASSLISLATTAMPLPASPARAASMVAFKARRLVCSLMEEMTFNTWPISALLLPNWITLRLASLATFTAEVATWAAWLALWAISRMLEDMP